MIQSNNIVIVDYGMGNLWSVKNAFKFLGAKCQISSNPKVIEEADALVLPGVGSFNLAMQSLHRRDLVSVIYETVKDRNRKILGICLGFQMLAESSSEDGLTAGLGLIPGTIERFSNEELQDKKLPHVGFNRVKMPSNDKLFFGFDNAADFYFVHSYRLLPSGKPEQTAICNYGIDFVAAYQMDNIFGTQFHPEKSQTNGLRLLQNFLNS